MKTKEPLGWHLKNGVHFAKYLTYNNYSWQHNVIAKGSEVRLIVNLMSSLTSSVILDNYFILIKPGFPY